LPVKLFEKSAVKPSLASPHIADLGHGGYQVMRFVFSGCCAIAGRIADAIISPATKSRRFIDHLIGDSEQC
jgi:hypothetical protein